MFQPSEVFLPTDQRLGPPGTLRLASVCPSNTRYELAKRILFKAKQEMVGKVLSCTYSDAFRMRAETEIDRAACGANRFICFVGDSHMRHAYNGVTSLFKGSLDWHGAPGASGAQKTDKSIMQVQSLLNA